VNKKNTAKHSCEATMAINDVNSSSQIQLNFKILLDNSGHRFFLTQSVGTGFLATTIMKVLFTPLFALFTELSLQFVSRSSQRLYHSTETHSAKRKITGFEQSKVKLFIRKRGPACSQCTDIARLKWSKITQLLLYQCFPERMNSAPFSFLVHMLENSTQSKPREFA
jgi:hypothetical protein